MAFAALVIGAIIIVVALNNTHSQLAAELENDLPGFFKWAVAIAIVLGLGFIPGLKTPSRWLLLLVVVVIVLTQFTAIKTGIMNFAQGSGQASPSPTATAGASAGQGGASPSTVTSLAGPAAFVAAFNPADFLVAALGG